MLIDEETRALYRKREEEFLESELKKFEKGLCNSRPRFRGPYSCSKRENFSSADNYEKLWKIAPRRVKVKVKDIQKTADTQKKNSNTDEEYNGSIKVTIKDKPTSGCKEREQKILRTAFQILVSYAKEERRLRELKIKIQDNIASKRLRKYFETWKTRMENSKKLAMKRKKEREMSDERKIEVFVNAINEKQKQLAKRPVMKEFMPRVKDTQEANTKQSTRESRKNSPMKKNYVVEPPASNRLDAQKKIIAEQKMRLAEQHRIIEELKLKQIEDEMRKSGKETINVAKEALTYCGQRTRRSLIQLIREEGCR